MKALYSTLFVLACLSTFAQVYDPDSLLTELKNTKLDAKARMTLYLNLSLTYMRRNADTAIYFQQLSEKTSLQQGDLVSYAISLDLDGVLKERSGDIEGALKVYLRVLTLADSLKNNELLIRAYSSLGSYYTERQDYPKALEFGHTLLKLLDPDQNHERSRMLYNMGLVYVRTGVYDSAEMCYLQGLKEAQKAKSENYEGLNCSGMSYLKFKQNDIKEGLKYGHKAYELLLRSQNFNQLLGAASTLGVGYSNLGDYKKANQYFLESLDLSRKLKSRSQEAMMLSNISVAYEKMGDYKLGYLYADTCITIYQSYISEEREKIRNELESRFDLERKDKNIALLQQENQIKALKISRQQQVQWGISLFAVMAFLLAIILWRNNQLRKKTNLLLKKEKDDEQAKRIQLELDYQRIQKEHILAQFDTLKSQINPHFLFNSLNSLSSMIGRQNPQAYEFLQKFTSLFRSTLELKERHLIPLSEELTLCSSFIYMQKIRFGDKLQVDLQPDLYQQVAWLPPFSLQMLMENAIKHNEISEESPLHISISEEKDLLMVSNPIKHRKDQPESTGIGLKNIISRYEMLSDRLPTFRIENNLFIASLPLIREEA